MSVRRQRRFAARVLFFGIAAIVGSSNVSAATNHFVRVGERRFDLSDDSELRALREAASALTATTDSSKTRRGSQLLESLAGEALTNAATKLAIEQSLREVAAALCNNSRSPVPAHVDVLQLPFVHYRYFSASIGRGEKPANNLQPANGETDLSRLGPLPSTFWSRPKNISAENLSVGFGRSESPRFEEKLWTYAAPKTSYGGHAGFESRCGDEQIKIKFGEIHSEPFTARIFHALGYNVEPTDYSPGLKIKYDRRIFTEFNSRKSVDTKITALGVLPVWTIHFQPVHDPFDFIAAAVMKDGTRMSGGELRMALLRATSPRGEGWGEGVRFENKFETQIYYLITVSANVQLKDPHEKSIGPWDFGQLGHENLRELRGAGLLAAWLGWFDSRFDNTRLRIAKDGDSARLKHVFADLGGGMGNGSTWSGWRGEVPADFPDSFTEPEIHQGKGRMTIPFRIANFRPIESTPAFREMTTDDARWMARMIAQLSEQQITDALRASGFSDSEVEIYRRKLLARRDKMLRDLGIANAASR